MASKNPIPKDTESHNWEWFAARQLTLDFEEPVIGSTGYAPSLSPSDLVLDRIYGIAKEAYDTADWDTLMCAMSEIANQCVEYFYSEDGY